MDSPDVVVAKLTRHMAQCMSGAPKDIGRNTRGAKHEKIFDSVICLCMHLYITNILCNNLMLQASYVKDFTWLNVSLADSFHLCTEMYGHPTLDQLISFSNCYSKSPIMGKYNNKASK